jgi:hypothetical protein
MSSLINLDGHFKVDLYNQNDELIESTDFANNFITTTGLSYPYYMPFAEGFKWLSLGTSNTANTIHTTGLYGRVDGEDYYEYSDAFEYLTGFYPAGCGYVEQPDGIDLYRAWRLPESGNSYMKKEFTFKEMMTSPGRPKKMATPNDTEVLYTGGALPVAPTKGLSAFSRVLQTFTVPSGDWAVITYKLGVTIDTGIRNFNKFIGLWDADSEHGSPDLWQNLTGQSKLLHPGVRIVKGEMNPDDGDENSKDGDTVLAPSVGGPMEPYESGKALHAYMSTDDTQFLFNPYWGGKVYTGAFRPWNDTSGAYFQHHGFPVFFDNIYSLTAKMNGGGGGGGGQDPNPESLKALREDEIRYTRWQDYRKEVQDEPRFPKPTDYKDQFEATKLGEAGYNWNSILITNDEHETTVFKGAEDFSLRTRFITRTCTWQPGNAKQDSVSPYDFIRYRSLVFGYSDPSDQDSKFIPFFDSLFGTAEFCSDNSSATEALCCTNNNGTWANDACTNGTETWAGRFLPTFTTPEVSHTSHTYTGALGNYPFHDDHNLLSITWKLTWSAPCGGVSNCTDP